MWTREDKDWLIANFPHIPTKECARYLGKPYPTTRHYARYLNLRKTKECWSHLQSQRAKGSRTVTAFGPPSEIGKREYSRLSVAAWRKNNPVRTKAISTKSRLKRTPKIKANRIAIKMEIFTHYGGGKAVCKHCGEDDIDVLTLHHISGGGSNHRRGLFKGKNYCGVVFYNKLKKLGFPPGLNVLCFNCHAKVTKGSSMHI